ncbi:MAG: hypothetical protein MJ252_17065, partial [archaeon]|nr:hypothetical protein [archaeon]
MNAIKDLSREISQELGEETATDSTYKDYGTSQQEGMEHQYNKYIEKRVKELLNALKEVLNKDLFTGISTEEIKEFYQATLKDYDWPEFDFNEGYQKKIMEVLGYQDKNQIGVREFIKGTVILEEKLKINKHKCQHAYENIKPKLEKCEGQLEKLNE